MNIKDEILPGQNHWGSIGTHFILTEAWEGIAGNNGNKGNNGKSVGFGIGAAALAVSQLSLIASFMSEICREQINPQ